MPTRPYATFTVAGQLFGLEVSAVQEVLLVAQYTPVPLAPPAIAGMFSLRGHLVAAVDLRVRLGLPRWDRPGSRVAVIVRLKDEPVGLLVDRIGEVVDVGAQPPQAPPPTLTGPARSLIVGAFLLDRDLLLAIDAEGAARAQAASGSGTDLAEDTRPGPWPDRREELNPTCAP